MRVGIRRRRGQGMTEYILLVGLIGILLVAVVGRFRRQIDVTIQGSTNQVDDISDDIRNGGSNGNNGGNNGGSNLQPTNRVASGGARDGQPLYTRDGSGGYYYADGTPHSGGTR